MAIIRSYSGLARLESQTIQLADVEKVDYTLEEGDLVPCLGERIVMPDGFVWQVQDTDGTVCRLTKANPPEQPGSSGSQSANGGWVSSVFDASDLGYIISSGVALEASSHLTLSVCKPLGLAILTIRIVSKNNSFTFPSDFTFHMNPADPCVSTVSHTTSMPMSMVENNITYHKFNMTITIDGTKIVIPKSNGSACYQAYFHEVLCFDVW